MYTAKEHKRPENLTIDELQTLSEIDLKVYDKCEEIFGYICKNHPLLLKFGVESIFEDYKIFGDTISIKYYKNKSNDFSTIELQWTCLTDDGYYEEDLKRMEDDLIRSRENMKKWEEKLARAQYEKLKKRFENNNENN